MAERDAVHHDGHQGVPVQCFLVLVLVNLMWAFRFSGAKIATARFYADHVLVQAPALRSTVVNGAAGVMALSEDQFLAA